MSYVFYRNVLNPFAAENTLACGIRFECAKRIIMYIRVEVFLQDFRVNLIEGQFVDHWHMTVYGVIKAPAFKRVNVLFYLCSS